MFWKVLSKWTFVINLFKIGLYYDLFKTSDGNLINWTFTFKLSLWPFDRELWDFETLAGEPLILNLIWTFDIEPLIWTSIFEPVTLNLWHGPFISEPLISDLDILTFDIYTLIWDFDYLTLSVFIHAFLFHLLWSSHNHSIDAPMLCTLVWLERCTIPSPLYYVSALAILLWRFVYRGRMDAS